ncbi:MAG: NAD(P)/FAD-dependent oxidoreductase [Candidatus Omnitrophota bacterium]
MPKNSKTHVCIIGCGFAGLRCAEKLGKHHAHLDITVIDRKATSDFLPLIPDIVGRNFPPPTLSVPIVLLARQHHFHFIRAEVSGIDREQKQVVTDKQRVAYDYLVLATGVRTNFYGNNELEKSSLTLRSSEDARRISRMLERRAWKNIFVCGGGYTGIEIATHARRRLKRLKRQDPITVIEKADTILGKLPIWMRDYTEENLRRLKIPVTTGHTVSEYRKQAVTLDNGSQFSDSLLIWVAGVRTPDFIQDMDVDKEKGRIVVGADLRMNDHIFAIGDCAAFKPHNQPLRMLALFAVEQGLCTAANIIRMIKGKPTKPYNPWDPGFVVPMANNRSCGTIYGRGFRGPLVTLSHYLMSAALSHGFSRKAGVMKHALKQWRMPK